MIIVSNQTTESGDILFMQTDIPAIGVSALIGFTDDTTGENPDVYYKKKFQISRDGVTWTEWQDLTIPNIQAIEVDIYSEIFVRYKYEHIGEGLLEFNSNTLTGDYTTLDCPFYFKQSIFSKYFGCHDLKVLRWYLNVVEKLYTVELNRYIKFDDGTGNVQDAISFWQSIARFFAYYVILARTYRDFYLNENLLDAYLRQRGLFTANYNTLTELNYLMANFGSEIMKRGTRQIYEKKDPSQLNQSYSELQRVLEITDNDELIIDQYLPQHCGWWIDEASPLYRGLEGHLNANKFPKEKYPPMGITWDFTDNFEQPITTNTGDGFLVEDEAELNEDNPNNIEIDFTGSGQLRYDGDVSKLIPIFIRNNYVIEFEIQARSSDALLSFGAECYSEQGEEIVDELLDFRNGTPNKWFIEDLSLQRLNSFPTKWFPVKGIVYNYRKPFFLEDSLNIGKGHNLTFDATIQKNLRIFPRISVTGEVSIRNIVVRPLASQYERGFVHMNNFISIDYANLEEPAVAFLGDNLSNQIVDENSAQLVV